MSDVIHAPVGAVRLVEVVERAGQMVERGIDSQGNTFERTAGGEWAPWKIWDEYYIQAPTDSALYPSGAGGRSDDSG